MDLDDPFGGGGSQEGRTILFMRPPRSAPSKRSWGKRPPPGLHGRNNEGP